MTRIDLVVWIAMLALCTGLIIWSWIYFAPTSPTADGADARTASELALDSPHIILTDQRGAPFDSTHLLGKAWIVDFIFTNCPGPCPIMTGNLRTLQKAIGPTDRLHLVSITCDPWRDTPEVLAAYAQAHGADQDQWTFLTGEHAKIQEYARALLLSVENPQEEAARRNREGAATESPGESEGHGGPIIHSSRFVLVGPDGGVRGWYSGTEAAEMERLVADAQALIATIASAGDGAGAGRLSGVVGSLPLVNALLNAVAAALLVTGLLLIRKGQRAAHQRIMVTAFLVSIAFLISYITYHTLRQMEHGVGHTRWLAPGAWRRIYYTILISHVVLAATVPFLAVRTLWLAAKGRFAAHRRLARVTWPIWMYVAVTGVIVYLMLYHLHPALLRGSPPPDAAQHEARVGDAGETRA